MITYLDSSIFTSPADVLVNTVNTQGVMGKGIALEFKKLFPEMFREYQRNCELGLLKPGVLMFYRTPGKSVLNFPTKTSWRRPSKVEYIEIGLDTFVKSYANLNIQSVAFPRLGCGNGDLDWEGQVKPLMESYLSGLPIRVFIHLQGWVPLPEHMTIQRMRKWLHEHPSEISGIEAWRDVLSTVAMGTEGWYLEMREVGHYFDDIDEVQAIVYGSVPHGGLGITQDEFVTFWRTLRQNGFAVTADLPPHVQAIGEDVFRLIERLPYLERMYFSVGSDQSGVKFAVYTNTVRPATLL